MSLTEDVQVPIEGNESLETPLMQREPGFPAPGQPSPYKKNTINLSLSFFFVFLSFSSTQNLESNVLRNKSLGSVTLGTIYLSMFFVNGFTPAIINKLGVKTSLILGMACMVLFITSNLYESWYTLVPSGALAGAGAAVLWSAQGVFLSRCAHGHMEYLSSSRNSYDRAMSQLSGLFWAIFQCTQVLGNLIAYGVFSIPVHDSVQQIALEHSRIADNESLSNATSISSAMELVNSVVNETERQAGGMVKWVHPNDDELPNSTKYVLFSLFALSAGFGTLFGLCMIKDPKKALESTRLHSESDASEYSQDNSVWRSATRGFRLLVNDTRLKMMIPLFIWSGFEASFAYGQLTTYFIRPNLGEKYVPIVMTSFGVTNVLGSILCSRYVSNRTQIRVLIVFAALIQVAVLIAIGFVQGTPEGSLPWYTVVSLTAVWGLGDAFYNSLITSLLAITFKYDETVAAFSQFKAWQSLATAIVFFFSPLLSPPLVDARLGLETKSILSIGACLLGTIVFLLGEAYAKAPTSTENPELNSSQVVHDENGDEGAAQ